MTGDQDDIVARMKAVMPTAWFPDEGSPILDAVLAGVAWLHAQVFGLLSYVQLQTRIATATDANVDLIAFDFTGNAVRRRPGETDAALKVRLKRYLFREKVTKNAVLDVLRELTGYTPDLFLPWDATAAGHYGPDGDTLVAAYDVQGRLGSRLMPFQGILTVFRDDPTVVTDQDIYDAILSVQSANEVFWTRITYPTSANAALLDTDFVLDESLLS